MKKSELKKYIKEALTPDEAVKVDSKYKEIYAGMLQDNPLKLKKYDNPDKVAYGRAIKLIQKESAKIAEKKLTAAEKAKKEDIIMALKKQKGGKDKLKPADYAIATDRAKKLAETGEEIAKKNMDMYKDKNRLEELVKAALMGPIKEGREYDADAMEALGFDLYPGGRYEAFKYATEDLGLSANEILGKLSDDDVYNAIHHSLQIMGMYDMDDAEELEEKQASTDKYDDNPALKGKQSELPDGLQKAIIKKAGGKVDEIKERILRELRGGINEMAGEDLELKSLAKKMIPTLKKLGFEVDYSTDTNFKRMDNKGTKHVTLRIQDGMLGAHIPFKTGLDAAKEIQREIQKSLGNNFEYKLTTASQGGSKFYTILIRNK